MYAIASLSLGKNGVGSHVAKWRAGKETLSPSSKIAQVDTNDYRRLHKLSNQGAGVELMDAFNDRPYDYSIDVQNATLHKNGCRHVSAVELSASIIDEDASGLKLCACLKS